MGVPRQTVAIATTPEHQVEQERAACFLQRESSTATARTLPGRRATMSRRRSVRRSAVDLMRGARMSTRVVVTGGSGFLGSLLARRLLTEPVTLGGAPPAELDELTMIDLVAPPDDVRTDRRVRLIAADLSAAVGDLNDVDPVFHLAGVVS